MTDTKMKNAFFIAFLIAVCAAASWCQNGGAKVQGTVKDSGKPIAGAEVVITHPDSSASYKSKTDENGVFEIQGIPTGTNYQLEVINSAGLKVFVSQQLAFNADAAGPAVLAIDTSDVNKTNLQAALEKRHYSREEIEALKAQNAKARQQNGLITAALEAINAKRWQDAIPPLKQLIADDPDRYEFYQSLGEAQFNLAQYDEAIQSFEKGIELANSNTPSGSANPAHDPVKKKARIASMLVNEGNAFLKLRKTNEAIDEFTRATSIDPDYPVAQFNLCAMLFNAQKIDAALPACDKSIALQPDRPDTYYIKANLLLARANRDKSSKDQSAAGAALKKYLDLAPEGPHVAKARELLMQIGAAAPANPGTKK